MSRGAWAGWLCTAAIGAGWLDAVTPSWRSSPDLGHAWAVPLLVGFLYWERWQERPAFCNDHGKRRAATGLSWGLLAALLLIAVPVRLLLTPYPLWPAALLIYTAIAVSVIAIAAAVIGGGAALRWVLPPLVLLVACIPIPTIVENGLLLPLREHIATIVAEVANVLGHPALAAGTSVRLAKGWIGVEEACSGIRSLQAALLFGLFFGEWFRFGAWRRVALVTAALAAAVAGNFARVLFLTLYSANQGGLDRVHDPAGWIAMIASLAVTAWLAAHWGGYRLPASLPSTPQHRCVSLPLAWLGTAAVGFVAIAAATHAWFHADAEAQPVPQWTARLPVEHWSFQPEPLSETAREMLRPDRFVSGRWKDGSNREVESYFVEWTHGQIARSVPFLHNPTVCLPYAGCELMETLSPIDVPSTAGRIRFFTYRFQRTGQSLLVAFTIWDPSRAQPLEHPEEYRTWWTWIRRQWRDVQERRRDQPAQLLAVSMVADESARPDLERLLRTLVVSESVAVRQGG